MERLTSPAAMAVTPTSTASTPMSSSSSTPSAVAASPDDAVVFKRELDPLGEADDPTVSLYGGYTSALYSSAFGAVEPAPYLFSPSSAPLSLADPAPLDLNQHQPAVVGTEDQDEELFSAYIDHSQPSHSQSSPAGGPSAWDLYYPQSPTALRNATAPPLRYPSTGSGSSSGGNAASLGIVRRSATPPAAANSTGNVTGAKRTYEALTSPMAATDRSTNNGTAPSPRGSASPTAAVASSMIAMRRVPDRAAEPKNPPLMVHARGGGKPLAVNNATNTINISTSARGVKKESKGAATSGSASDATAGSTSPTSGGTSTPTSKKTKVSRERQLKINAASRRCRKKQKLELQFLRAHVVELQSALKDQVAHLRSTMAQQPRAARLAHFVEESVRKVDEMSSGTRSTGSTPTTVPPFSLDAFQMKPEEHSGEDTDVNQIETDDASSVHQIDPATGYSLSEERKQELLHVSAFIRVNMTLESGSFSPEVISCLPIEMDGWQLRLAITEKNYTIHNAKFFPCKFRDMYDFCWETNVAQKISIKHGRKHYVVVTPLDADVAHVYSKTIGKWSLNVHGVPNVSYNSLVCRRVNPDQQRAIICQQSVLEERDFQDKDTIPWLFKRWVVFRPHVVDGVEGTYVEAYRTASYATGRLIYKGHNTYDSFCEHLIRRYAESNSLLEKMMARDSRFSHAFDPSLRAAASDTGTVSDRMIKDLLLF